MEDNFRLKAALIIAGLPPGEYSSYDLHALVSKYVANLPPRESLAWTQVTRLCCSRDLLERTGKKQETGVTRRFNRGGRIAEQKQKSGKSRSTGIAERYKSYCKIYRRTNIPLVIPERIKEEILSEMCQDQNIQLNQ